jgi:Protein of unknown function (DUF2934)
MKIKHTMATQGSTRQHSGPNRSTSRENGSRVPVPQMSMHEQIASLAYALWEQRDRSQGSAEEDWKQAERELRHRAKGVSH